MVASIEEKLQQKLKEIASIVQEEEQRLKAERQAIEADRAQLDEDRATFEAEKEVVAAANKVTDSKVKLDVGGAVYHVSRMTLTSKPGSMLEAMFSGRHELEEDKDGHVFIDRDGATFKLVLEYLRSPTSFTLDGLSKREVASCEAEFDYYGLPSPAPSPVPPAARPLSLRMITDPNGQMHARLRGDERSCTVSRDSGPLVPSWAVGAEVLADGAVWKTHVKAGPDALMMGVIANPTPSTFAHGDATFAGWYSPPNIIWFQCGNQDSPGWPGWQQGDEAIFKLNVAARTLTLHLKRTGQSYAFENLPSGKDGQWRFCICVGGLRSTTVVLSRATEDERTLVQ